MSNDAGDEGSGDCNNKDGGGGDSNNGDVVGGCNDDGNDDVNGADGADESKVDCNDNVVDGYADTSGGNNLDFDDGKSKLTVVIVLKKVVVVIVVTVLVLTMMVVVILIETMILI